MDAEMVLIMVRRYFVGVLVNLYCYTQWELALGLRAPLDEF